MCSFFFFKQKTAYEMRTSDWSSDVCSSDLLTLPTLQSAMPFQRPDPSNGPGHVIFEDHERPPDATKNRPDRVIEPVPFTLFGGVLFADAKIGRASCRERVCQYV